MAVSNTPLRSPIPTTQWISASPQRPYVKPPLNLDTTGNPVPLLAPGLCGILEFFILCWGGTSSFYDLFNYLKWKNPEQDLLSF